MQGCEVCGDEGCDGAVLWRMCSTSAHRSHCSAPQPQQRSCLTLPLAPHLASHPPACPPLLAPQVLKLLRRRERWLVVAAVRFLRTALNMKVQRGSGLACGSGCVCVWQAGANLGCLGHASAGAAA